MVRKNIFYLFLYYYCKYYFYHVCNFYFIFTFFIILIITTFLMNIIFMFLTFAYVQYRGHPWTDVDRSSGGENHENQKNIETPDVTIINLIDKNGSQWQLGEIMIFVCLSICLSVCLSVLLSVSLSVCLSVCLLLDYNEKLITHGSV